MCGPEGVTWSRWQNPPFSSWVQGEQRCSLGRPGATRVLGGLVSWDKVTWPLVAVLKRRVEARQQLLAGGARGQGHWAWCLTSTQSCGTDPALPPMKGLCSAQTHTGSVLDLLPHPNPQRRGLPSLGAGWGQGVGGGFVKRDWMTSEHPEPCAEARLSSYPSLPRCPCLLLRCNPASGHCPARGTEAHEPASPASPQA